MSNDLVSFTCGACEATLSISVELAGVSGPCPYCGTHVTSPRVEKVREPEVDTIDIELPESKAPEPRPWLKVQMMTGDETVTPRRSYRAGWLIVAGIAVFAGGVAGVWRFWAAERPKKAAGNTLEIRVSPRPIIKPRSEVLAAAGGDFGHAALLPPPADEIPSSRLAPAVGAIAHDLSTASGGSVPVVAMLDARPQSSSIPAGSPGVTTQATPSAAEMSTAERQIREAIVLGGYLEKPGAAMIRFFAATTWQERLKFTLAPEKVKPVMEAYYRDHPDGPIIPEDIELVRVESVEDDPNRKCFAFNVYMPDVEAGIPLSVEETTTGCLIEWCSFIEGKDRLLEKFYASYRQEPATFRVLVRRGHYFENDVPDQDSKSYFLLRPPDGTGPFPLWADRDSVVHSRYFASGERSRWNISSMMVLKLQWERTREGVEYVRLVDVVADNWHPAMLPK